MTLEMMVQKLWWIKLSVLGHIKAMSQNWVAVLYSSLSHAHREPGNMGEGAGFI